MEHLDMDEMLLTGGDSPPASSGGSVTLVQVEESSVKTTISTERPGRRFSPNDDEEAGRYLRQRAPAPQQETFK